MSRYLSSGTCLSVVFAAAILANIGECNTLYADDAVLEQHVAALLDAGWENEPSALGSAEAHYRTAQRTTAGDFRVQYAWALVQLKQRRYTDAAVTLDALVKDRPDFLPGRQAQIWLNVLRKRYSEALVQMERLSREFTATDLSGEEEELQYETARFLGRVLAYLSGPVAGAVPEHRLADARRTIIGRLTTTRAAGFNQGFDDVTRQFEELAATKSETRAEVKQQQEQQKEMQREQLQQEKQEVAGQKLSVEQQAQQAQAAAQAAIDSIDQQLAPLDAEFNRLALQGQQVQSDIVRLELEISRLLTLADEAIDPDLRNYYLLEADRVGSIANSARRQYALLDQQAAQINAQRSALHQQRQQVLATYQAETKRLGVQAERLDRTAQRISREQRDVLQPATGDTARVRVLSTATTAFTTYQPFPLERERQRVLDLFE